MEWRKCGVVLLLALGASMVFLASADAKIGDRIRARRANRQGGNSGGGGQIITPPNQAGLKVNGQGSIVGVAPVGATSTGANCQVINGQTVCVQPGGNFSTAQPQGFTSAAGLPSGAVVLSTKPVLQSSASKKAQTKSVKSEVDDSAALIAKLDAAYDKLEESDRLKREARGELALAEAGIRGDIAVKSARAASRVEMLKLKHDQQVDEIQSELVELKKLAGLVDPAPPVE